LIAYTVVHKAIIEIQLSIFLMIDRKALDITLFSILNEILEI